MQAFTSGVSGTFVVYFTSDFSAHSLTATTSILSSLMAGLIKLPYAKFLDNFGRPHGFCLAVASMTIGLAMMAGCQNVETYCAAQVFYAMGYNCIDFTLTIFVVDTSQLKNRALMIAYVATPWLITTWIYGPAAQRMLETFGFRWGYGIWAIVFPVVCSPLVICFLIFGGLLVIAFFFWEKYLAPVTFIPWALLKNRTVVFTFTMMASLYCAWYIWDSYFYFHEHCRVQPKHYKCILHQQHLHCRVNILGYRHGHRYPLQRSSQVAGHVLWRSHNNPRRVSDDPLPPAGHQHRLHRHVSGFLSRWAVARWSCASR